MAPAIEALLNQVMVRMEQSQEAEVFNKKGVHGLTDVDEGGQGKCGC